MVRTRMRANWWHGSKRQLLMFPWHRHVNQHVRKFRTCIQSRSWILIRPLHFLAAASAPDVYRIICLLPWYWCITWMAGWVWGADGDSFSTGVCWCHIYCFSPTGRADMWLSASTVVSSSAAGSTGMETLSQNRRLSRQRTSMYGLRWGVCQFMSLCCKFHVLSDIVSMAITVILTSVGRLEPMQITPSTYFLASLSASEVLFNSESLWSPASMRSWWLDCFCVYR